MINLSKKIKYGLVIMVCLMQVSLTAQPYNFRSLSDDVTPNPLDLRVNRMGDIQIYRNGNPLGQLYYPVNDAYGQPNGSCGGCFEMYNGIFMRIGPWTTATESYALFGFDDYWVGSVSGVTGSGTEIDPWQITGTHQGNSFPGFGFDITYSYVNGKQYIDVSLVAKLPNNNNNDIKIFHIMDTYLNSSDNGAAYTSGTAPYDIVGVEANDGSIFEAFVVTEDPWDRYSSHLWEDVLNEPYNDGELSNTLDTDPNTDNAIAVQWNLGIAKGVQPAIKYRIGFTTDVTTLISCGKAFMNRQVGRIIKSGG